MSPPTWAAMGSRGEVGVFVKSSQRGASSELTRTNAPCGVGLGPHGRLGGGPQQTLSG